MGILCVRCGTILGPHFTDRKPPCRLTPKGMKCNCSTKNFITLDDWADMVSYQIVNNKGFLQHFVHRRKQYRLITLYLQV